MDPDPSLKNNFDYEAMELNPCSNSLIHTVATISDDKVETCRIEATILDSEIFKELYSNKSELDQAFLYYTWQCFRQEAEGYGFEYDGKEQIFTNINNGVQTRAINSAGLFSNMVLKEVDDSLMDDNDRINDFLIRSTSDRRCYLNSPFPKKEKEPVKIITVNLKKQSIAS